MDEEINKLIVVSLCDSFTRKVGSFLSQDLGMMFCDTKALLEYELIDKDAMEKLCTVEYLIKAEERVFAQLASFENVVVGIGFDDLIHHYEILKEKSVIIFLNLSQSFVESVDEKVNLIAYENRTAKLEKIANINVNPKQMDEKLVCKDIVQMLGGIL